MSARARLAAIVGLVVFSILAGTTASWAFWSTQLHATSTATRAALDVSIVGFDTGAAATYSNSTLATTGAVTFTNSTVTSSTTAGAVTATITGSGTLASKVKLTVWAPTTNATSACTSTATATSATVLATWSTSGGVSLSFSLAPGASKVYCLRSEVQGGRIAVTTASGTQSFTPSVTAQLKLGNLVDTETATATQQTKNIFPVTTLTVGKWFWMRPSYSNDTYQYCADMNGGGTGSGTIVISYGCKDTGSTNQMWSFEAGTGTYASYYRIIPRNSTGLRVDTNSGTAGISANTLDTADAGQYWVAQLTPAGTIQFVNYVSGLCLSAPVGNVQNNGNVTQSECVVGDGQQWILSRTLENPARTAANNGASNATLSYTWDDTTTTNTSNGTTTTSVTSTYTLQVYANGAWATVPTTATGSTGLTYRLSALYTAAGSTQGTLSIQILDGYSTRVGLGSVTFTKSGNTYTATAATISGIQ